jgi:L-fucose mutarotase
MQVVGDPEAVPDVVRDATPALEAEGGAGMAALERFAFYERAKRVFAVLHTLEPRPYGNFILRKGVIFA